MWEISGVTFTLTATSRNTDRWLSVVFTDATPGTPFAAVLGQSPNPVVPGGSATYTIQINYAGTNALCTVDLSAAATTSPNWSPTFEFSDSSVTGKGTGGGGSGATPINPQSTLTVTTPPGHQPNTYQFTVTRTSNQQPGETCQGPGTQTSLPINLIVALATTTTLSGRR